MSKSMQLNNKMNDQKSYNMARNILGQNVS